MMNDTQDKKMREDEADAEPFVIKDNRHWADESETTKTGKGKRARKPSYVADLEKRLQESEQKVAQIRQAHTESAAEFDDVKTRIRRRHAEEIERAKLQVAESLFDLADNLDRMVEAGRGDTDTESLLDGITLVRDQFFQKLDEFGVKRFSPNGEYFDPAHHDAVAVIPVEDDAQHNVIVEVLKPGFKAGDQILRPAMVQVGKVQSTPTSKPIPEDK